MVRYSMRNALKVGDDIHFQPANGSVVLDLQAYFTSGLMTIMRLSAQQRADRRMLWCDRHHRAICPF